MSGSRDDRDREEREALQGVEDQLAQIRERHRNDPSLELLRAARADVLPEELQKAVSRHLDESAWSRALLDGVPEPDATLTPETEQRLLARIKKEAARAHEPGAWGWLHRAVFASALAAAALVAWVVTRPNVTSSPSGPTSTVAVATPPPALVQLSFDKPDVRLSMAALTWRGASAENQLLTDLKPALDAYRRSDYAAADEAFSALSTRYPQSIEVLFYQGVARLFRNDFTGAINVLTAAETVADGTFLPDVRWYRAVAEQNAGHFAEARTRLDAICRDTSAGGDHAARGCAALTRIEGVPSAPKP